LLWSINYFTEKKKNVASLACCWLLTTRHLRKYTEELQLVV